MASAFLFGLAIALLLLAMHPFVFYPLSLYALRAATAAPPPPARTGRRTHSPSLAICVCAYNEAAVIRQTLLNLLELRRRRPGLKILLYVDGATDRTAEIAGEFVSEIQLIVSAERQGKIHGVNRLASLADTSILVLADANVRIDRNALVNLERYFDDPEIGCVCGHLTYVNSGETVTTATGSLYWRLEEAIKQLESDTGSVMGADGSLYAIRRSLFRPIPRGTADDMYLSLDVLCQGYRVVRAPDVRVFERSVPRASEEFQRKIRISCQSFGTHRALWPQLRRLGPLNVYKYVSHKLIRWFTAATLAAALLSAFAGIAVAAGPLAASGLVLGTAAAAYGAFRIKVRAVTVVVDIGLSFLATLLGVWRAMRGVRIGTWEPAGSVRES